MKTLTRYLFLYLVTVIALVGCKQSTNEQVGRQSNATNTPSGNSSAISSSTRPTTDTCALLTAEEIKTIQGEEVKDTKLSARSDGGFSVSQCFFTLATFTNSISLAVTQKTDEQGARDPREFWDETFHRKEEGENEHESEEKDEAKPARVTGVGDEAFWMGSRVGGALYVLKGNKYLRISVGGAADQESKINRSKALAEKAISRL